MKKASCNDQYTALWCRGRFRVGRLLTAPLPPNVTIGGYGGFSIRFFRIASCLLRINLSRAQLPFQLTCYKGRKKRSVRSLAHTPKETREGGEGWSMKRPGPMLCLQLSPWVECNVCSTVHPLGPKINGLCVFEAFVSALGFCQQNECYVFHENLHLRHFCLYTSY